jgi:hypothetical protein
MLVVSSLLQKWLLVTRKSVSDTVKVVGIPNTVHPLRCDVGGSLPALCFVRVGSRPREQLGRRRERHQHRRSCRLQPDWLLVASFGALPPPLEQWHAEHLQTDWGSSVVVNSSCSDVRRRHQPARASTPLAVWSETVRAPSEATDVFYSPASIPQSWVFLVTI